MIIVHVFLKSAIDKSRDKTLAMLTICNDGTGDAKVRNYEVRQLRAPEFKLDKPQKVSAVKGHRAAALSVWVLLRKALQSLNH